MEKVETIENLSDFIKINNDLIEGRIVLLDPEKTENKMFAGCFMVVTEIKNWGVQGYVQSLGNNCKPGGQAYYRAEYGTFALTKGIAVWICK